jgi:hypothetical protein
MGNFNYCSHKDELLWHFPEDWPLRCNLKREYLDSDPLRRMTIRKWIQEKCKGDVFVWNLTTYVRQGESNYGDKISPQGNITLYFENSKDLGKFLLTTDYKAWISDK